MVSRSNLRGGPTRRDCVKYGAALLGGGVTAGCTGESDSGPESAASGANGDGVDEPYTVSMSPVGDVEFDAVPEQVFTVFPQYLDMAVALGYGDAVNAVYVPEMSGTTMNHYYHHLDGVSLEWDGLHDPLQDGLSKEMLYELDSDVLLADPAWASTQSGWTKGEVEEVGSTLAPWFGNFYSGTHDPAPEGYDDYQYYTLWELFGKVAEVFREQERYEALAAVHEDLLARIEQGLPPEEDRPTVVRATLSEDGSKFWTYHLNEPGYWLADTRPLGATDAFAAEDWDGLFGTVDYEVMLEADPDVILHLWGLTPNYSMADTRRKLEDHPAGKDLTAVKEGRVYPAGMRYQGPIMNLFQLEMGAKQLYPEQFGEWPDYRDGERYPDIPADEQLFDRQRVASIIDGDA